MNDRERTRLQLLGDVLSIHYDDFRRGAALKLKRQSMFVIVPCKRIFLCFTVPRF